MKASHINLLLYCSHALSAWGDRMWAFAVGLFLVELMPGSLRLTASYGFSSGGSILLLGAIIGNWVDRNHRLTVARNSIIFQNLSVCMSAVAICILVSFEFEVREIWSGWLETILLVAVIVFAVLADIGSVARQISIERDWVIIICPTKKELTAMSAFLRRIDLATNILAPIATGQIITYGSTMIGAIFIAAWNIVSLFVEFGMLYFIYHNVPALHHKNFGDSQDQTSPLLEDHGKKNYGSMKDNSNDPYKESSLVHESQISPKSSEVTNEVCIKYGSGNHESGKIESFPAIEVGNNSHEKKPWYWPFQTIGRGWKAYVHSEVLLPGLALGSVYMTVIGFDNVTIGYAKEQGLSESIIGILMAAGALVGIIGTVLFPVMRNRIGLAKTGVVALCFQVACLTLCALSVFAPGTPFEPGYFLNDHDSEELGLTTFVFSTIETSYSVTSTPEVINKSLISVILLMAGIVSSRAGLWIADLSVTQLLMEKPREFERGIINGVQNSINKMADILKFLLVILLPLSQTFGYLIFISIAFILLALIMYSVYAAKHWGTDMRKDVILGGDTEKLSDSCVEKSPCNYPEKNQVNHLDSSEKLPDCENGSNTQL